MLKTCSLKTPTNLSTILGNFSVFSAAILWYNDRDPIKQANNTVSILKYYQFYSILHVLAQEPFSDIKNMDLRRKSVYTYKF